MTSNLYHYNGKEEQQIAGTELAVLDYGARTYDPWLSRWTSIDPLAAKYYSTSPYVFCNNSPVNYVDPWGMDWYSTGHIRYNKKTHEFESYNMYHWTDAKSQDDLSALGINGTYLDEAVVVFEGHYDERLGNDGTLTGEEAKAANVTVYGPRGKTDIENYIGFTMSSDYESFGAIEDGLYNVSFVTNKTRNKIPKTHIVNSGEGIYCINGKNYYYPHPEAYSPTHKNAIYVHRTNATGFAGYNRITGSAVSKGCLLINANSWDRYEKQINNTPYKLIINRK